MSKDNYYDQEVLTALCNLFARFAVKGRIAGDDNNGVVMYRSDDASPVVVFRFVTKDDADIQIKVDMKDVFKSGRDYLESTLISLNESIGEYMSRRSSIIINSAL